MPKIKINGKGKAILLLFQQTAKTTVKRLRKRDIPQRRQTAQRRSYCREKRFCGRLSVLEAGKNRSGRKSVRL